jgi:hypothetical protein
VPQGKPVSDGERSEVLGLWEADRISKADVGADKRLRDVYRQLGRTNLFFLTKGILGYKDLTVRTHKEFTRFVEDETNPYTLALLPRGCFKTTINSIGYPTKKFLNDPNVKMLLTNQIIENASIILDELEGHFDGSNRMVNWLYEEYVKPNERFHPFNSERMTVPCRETLKGPPTIMVAGVGTRVESRHVHILISDDLIGEKARDSQPEMLAAIRWHDYSVSLFVDPSRGIERAVGTRWVGGDLYETMIESGNYKVFWREAWNEEKDELFFPERLTRDVLRKIRDNNYAHFESQYQNNPYNESVLEFRKEWLTTYRLVEKNLGAGNEPVCMLNDDTYRVSAMDVLIIVDTAGSGDIDTNFATEAKKGRAIKSNNAIAVVGIHGTGRVFLLDYWVGRGVGRNPELQVAEQLLIMAKRWNGYFRTIFCEAFGGHAAFITVFNMLCEKDGSSFSIEEIPRGMKKAKHVRIRGALGGIAANGLLSCRQTHDHFITEFTKFPNYPLQDLIDATAWAVILFRKPREPVVQKLFSQAQAVRKQRRLASIGRGGY